MEVERCGICKYYDGSYPYTCVRFPPLKSTYDNGTHIPIHVSLSSDHWCGEFKLKSKLDRILSERDL